MEERLDQVAAAQHAVSPLTHAPANRLEAIGTEVRDRACPLPAAQTLDWIELGRVRRQAEAPIVESQPSGVPQSDQRAQTLEAFLQV